MDADAIADFECVAVPTFIALPGSGTALTHPVRYRTICTGDVQIYKDMRIFKAELGDDPLNRYFFAVLEGGGEGMMAIGGRKAEQASKQRSQ